MAQDTKLKLILAAEQVVIEEGSKALTLDRIAEKAGLSKGGLLYHYPTKESLLQAMIQHYIDSFDTMVDEVLASKQMNYPEAYINAFQKDNAGNIGRALVAIVAEDPDLIDPLRAQYRVWQKRLAASLSPVNAALLRFALDGIWLAGIFNLPMPPKSATREMLEYLQNLN